MESVRSPLSGDEDQLIETENRHRRHQSAGTLEMMGSPAKQQKQEMEKTNSPPRIIDGLFDTNSMDPNDKRVVDIIEQQFNLEILLKHNQLVEIEEEIGKCEAQMIALRNKYNVDPSKRLPSEPTEFTEKYLMILQKTEGLYNRHKSVTWNNNYLDQGADPAAVASSAETLYSRTRSHTSSLRPSSGRYSATDCIYRRSDGVLVKLTCPNCSRCNFSSAQGFLNHSRLAHGKEYTSHDNAALICGEVLFDDDQDADGLKSINTLRSQGLDPNKNMTKPEVPFISEMLKRDTEAPVVPRAPVLVPTAEKVVEIKPKRATTTTNKLKLKLKNLGKASEFDALIKDVTEEVENPHLFDDEEEADDDGSSATASVPPTPSKASSVRNNTQRVRSTSVGSRARRKSRGGFTLVSEQSKLTDGE